MSMDMSQNPDEYNADAPEDMEDIHQNISRMFGTTLTLKIFDDALYNPMGVLKSMAESIDPRAPMLVIKYATFKEHGCIPRSSDEKTVPLSKLPADIKVRRLFFPIYCHTCAGPTLLSLSHAFPEGHPTAADLCERLLARRRLCSSRTGGFGRGTPRRSARRMGTSGRARRIPTTRRLPSTGSSATE